MFSRKKNQKKVIEKVAERELRQNKRALKSLRDYDQGKKTISTRNLERRLPHIRVTS